MGVPQGKGFGERLVSLLVETDDGDVTVNLASKSASSNDCSAGQNGSDTATIAATRNPRTRVRLETACSVILTGRAIQIFPVSAGSGDQRGLSRHVRIPPAVAPAVHE